MNDEQMQKLTNKTWLQKKVHEIIDTIARVVQRN